jgi:hypothetical protein
MPLNPEGTLNTINDVAGWSGRNTYFEAISAFLFAVAPPGNPKGLADDRSIRPEQMALTVSTACRRH